MLEELFPRSGAGWGLVGLGEHEHIGIRNVQMLCDCVYRLDQIWCGEDEAGFGCFDEVGELQLLVAWVRSDKDGASANDSQEDERVVDLREPGQQQSPVPAGTSTALTSYMTPICQFQVAR